MAGCTFNGVDQQAKTSKVFLEKLSAGSTPVTCPRSVGVGDYGLSRFCPLSTEIEERFRRGKKEKMEKMELVDGHCHLVVDARKHVGREWRDGEEYEWLSEEALEVVVGTCPTVSL